MGATTPTEWSENTDQGGTRLQKTFLFLQISQPNILKQMINTCWSRNVLSFRRQQKVQLVFKTHGLFFFFPGEFQISADTLRQKGRFSFSLKSTCFSLFLKKNPNQKKPFIQSNWGGAVCYFFSQFSWKKHPKVTHLQYLVLRAVDNSSSTEQPITKIWNMLYFFLFLHLAV